MLNNLMLASSNEDRLASWRHGLSDFACTTIVVDKLLVDRLAALKDKVVKTNPHVLLLDSELFGLDGSNDVAGLRNLCTETRTIIIGGDISEDMEWDLLKVGVRGCCRSDIGPTFLHQVVEAVHRGELWVRRTLTRRLIDELGKTTAKNKAYRVTLGLLNNLTQREYDIAVRVGNGESNKHIAHACNITERTVKAHLTEIYFKLGVTDRLNLALVLSADNRSATVNSGGALNGGSRINDST